MLIRYLGNNVPKCWAVCFKQADVSRTRSHDHSVHTAEEPTIILPLNLKDLALINSINIQITISKSQAISLSLYVHVIKMTKASVECCKWRRRRLSSSVHVCVCVHLQTILRLSHLTKCLSKISVFALTFAPSLTFLVSVYLRPLALRCKETLELSLFRAQRGNLGQKHKWLLDIWRRQGAVDSSRHESCNRGNRKPSVVRFVTLHPTLLKHLKPFVSPVTETPTRAGWQRSSDTAGLVNMHSE